MIALLLQRLNKQRGSEIMTQVLRQSTCYGKLPKQKWTQSDLFWRGVLGQLLCRAQFGDSKKRVSECQLDLNEANTVLSFSGCREKTKIKRTCICLTYLLLFLCVCCFLFVISSFVLP